MNTITNKIISKAIILVIITTITIGFSNHTIAQINNEKNEMYNTWSAGFSFGSILFSGDIKEPGLSIGSKELKSGLNLYISKHVSPFVGFNINFLSGKIGGMDKDNSVYFTNNFHETTFNTSVSLTNLFFPNLAHKKFNVYGFIGIGVIQFQAEKRALNSNIIIETSPFITPNMKTYTTELVVPKGIGLKYNLNQYIDFGTEISLRETNTDKLDVEHVVGSRNDKYIYTNIGITYHFGYFNKSIEWISPMDIRTANDPLYADNKNNIDSIATVLSNLNNELNKKSLGLKVDNKETDKKEFTIATLYYNINSYELNNIDQEKIINVVKELNYHPEYNIILISRIVNKQENHPKHLSAKRTTKIKNLLTQWYNIDSKRIHYKNVIISEHKAKELKLNMGTIEIILYNPTL